MVQIGQRFLQGQPPLSREVLAKELGLSETGATTLAAPLIEGGYLAESGPCLLMARDPASYELATLWRHLRGAKPEPGPAPAVAAWLDQAEQSVAAQGATSFRDWLLGHSGPARG